MMLGIEPERPDEDGHAIELPPGDPEAIRAIAGLFERAGAAIEGAEALLRAGAEGELCEEGERLEVSMRLAVIEREMVAFTDPVRAFGEGPLARTWRATLPRWSGMLAYFRRSVEELPARERGLE